TIVHEDLAQVEGVRVAAVRLAFMILIALVVAVAMKIVGILLIISMLIIPAATARRFSATPEMMAGLAVLIGVGAVAGGLTSSLRWDTPAGPSIVAAASVLFFVSLLFGLRVRRGTPGA
ncbi:MAG: metal ABC transporter permease, partial [Proteobacteria bacterium]|nr:metal ABC transporter permease [Pseudomonadota bacterium]